MSEYAVGDIQGCHQPLMELLQQVSFNPKKDRLWVAGDMVNRGPHSRETLHFLYRHRDRVTAVLGNHDLHLLAIYHGIRPARRSDTFDDILSDTHCNKWMAWLQSLPLCTHDRTQGYTMVHAGIAPMWTLNKALKLSREVESVLQSRDIKSFLKEMYGNTPSRWHDQLGGNNRLRCITNYFTRMRVVDQQGALELNYKDDLNNIPTNHYAWFQHPQRKTHHQRIIFGHWASLGGHVNNKTLFGLDTGCVWGEHLTLMNLETNELTLACANTTY